MTTEPGPQGSVPLMMISATARQEAAVRLPAVVFLHGTGSDKGALQPLIEEYAGGWTGWLCCSSLLQSCI